METKAQRVAIFEPWHIGDVTISLGLAKELTSCGRDVFFICSSEYTSWVETLGLARTVIPVNIPWTDTRKKYDPRKYRPMELLAVRRQLKWLKPDVVVDPRGDPRNVAFIRIGLGQPCLSQLGMGIVNRYEKISMLLKRLTGNNRSHLHVTDQILKNGSTGEVVCFFGARWRNRTVPFEVATKLVRDLTRAGLGVAVILEPDEKKAQWQSLAEQTGGSLRLVQGSLTHCTEELKKAALALTTDSAWLHLAHFYGLDTIGLFGFDTATEFAPPGSRVVLAKGALPARSRYSLGELEHASCPLKNLPIEETVQQVLSALNK